MDQQLRVGVKLSRTKRFAVVTVDAQTIFASQVNFSNRPNAASFIVLTINNGLLLRSKLLGFVCRENFNTVYNIHHSH